MQIHLLLQFVVLLEPGLPQDQLLAECVPPDTIVPTRAIHLLRLVVNAILDSIVLQGLRYKSLVLLGRLEMSLELARSQKAAFRVLRVVIVLKLLQYLFSSLEVSIALLDITVQMDQAFLCLAPLEHLYRLLIRGLSMTVCCAPLVLFVLKVRRVRVLVYLATIVPLVLLIPLGFHALLGHTLLLLLWSL